MHDPVSMKSFQILSKGREGKSRDIDSLIKDSQSPAHDNGANQEALYPLSRNQKAPLNPIRIFPGAKNLLTFVHGSGNPGFFLTRRTGGPSPPRLRTAPRTSRHGRRRRARLRN